MAATSKMKQAQYDKRRHKKIKRKRSLDKIFDKEYKQKQALRQRKRRDKLKQQQQQHTVTPTLSPGSSSITTKSDLRKKEGLQRRRSNTLKLKQENADLRASIRQLTIENNKLKVSRQQTPSRPSPTKILLDNISPSSKKRGILRIKDQKEHLLRGSAEDFRKKLGVNLSNSNAPKKTTPSTLRNTIEQFLCQDQI